MTDVLVTPAFLPSDSLDTGDTSKLGPKAWKASRLFTGGGNARDLCMRDGAASTGASWVAPSVAVTKTDIGLSNVENTKLSTYVVPVALGGTNLTGYAVGDLLYASGAGVLAKLADVAAGSVLVSGGVGVAPAYSASPSLTQLTLSTALLIGTNPSTTGCLRGPNNDAFYQRNAANNADARVIGLDSNDFILIGDAGRNTVTLGAGSASALAAWGGNTASFPAIQASGTTLVIRLGNGASGGSLTLSGGTLTLPGGATLLATGAALTSGAAAATATMTNAPTAGNPTKWVAINDNGTTRYIPAW